MDAFQMINDTKLSDQQKIVNCQCTCGNLRSVLIRSLVVLADLINARRLQLELLEHLPKEKPKNLVLEGVVDYDKEDGGRALIATIEDVRASDYMFVRIQSWDDNKEHKEARYLEGKRVRVTVEVLD